MNKLLAGAAKILTGDNAKGVVAEAGNTIEKTFGSITNLVDETFTSKEEKGDQRLKWAELKSNLLIQRAQIQTELNKINALSSNPFHSGWRPFIGWILGISLGVYFIPQFVMYAYIWSKICLEKGEIIILDVPAANHLFELLTAMLGIYAIRAYENQKKMGK